MSQYLSFHPNAIALPGALKLIISTTTYRRVLERRENPDQFFSKLSQTRVLVAALSKKGDLLYLNFPQYVLVCALNAEGLFVKHLEDNDFHKQGMAMKYGVSFQLPQELLVSIQLTEYEKYIGFAGGRSCPLDVVKMRNCSAAAAFMLTQLRQTKQKDTEQTGDAPEVYAPGRKLGSLLDVAQRYAQYQADLEQQAALNAEGIPFENLRGSEAQKIDRAMYDVDVKSLPEELTPKKTYLELQDNDDNAQTVLVIEVRKKSSHYTLTLLFRQQMDRTDLPDSGVLRRPINTVNLDVQLAAIDKLRTGQATAKYMDLVLGERSSAGFESTNIQPFLEQLRKQTPPPNASQLEAIEKGIRSRDIYLVQGPPGTGKTTVILQWVRYFVQQEHKRVLVSSETNAAVDNVLTRFAEEGDIDMLRLGHAETQSATIAPYTFEHNVETLHEKIHTSAEQNLENILALTEPWKAYMELVDKAAAQYDDCQEDYRAFQNAARTSVLPYIQMLSSLEQENRKLGSKLLRAAAKLTRLAQKLAYHEDARGFVRFLTGLLYPLRKARLKKLHSTYLQLRQKEQEALQVYRANYASYEKALQLLRDNNYASLERSYDAMNRQMARLSAKPFPDPERDIWDIFAGSRSYTPSDPRHLDALKRQVQLDLDRAAGLMELLTDWDKEMGNKQNYALADIVMDSVQLVGATCIGIQTQKRFANMDFDVTIIDEAGQILIHHALVPMSVSNKVIMLGDEQQLAPFVPKGMEALCAQNPVMLDEELLDTSLFEYLSRGLPRENQVMLDTQYRMPGQIADLLSEVFYRGQYRSPDFKRQLPGIIPALSELPFVVVDTSGMPGRFEGYEAKSVYNTRECQCMLAIMSHLIRQEDINLEQVGLITPHKPQVARLRAGLERLLPNQNTSHMVMTLDSCQGQERDIILFCFNRSRRQDDSPRVGFLTDLRRLNVALSRCKKTLVIIGDMEYLSGCGFQGLNKSGEYIDEKPFGEFMQKLLALCDGTRGQRIAAGNLMQLLEGGKA